MNLLEYLDRAGQRRLERWRIQPPRPRDTKLLVAVLFFLGYYAIVFFMLRKVVPAENVDMVRDAMLVLGPVIGGIGTSIFRSDVRDEISASNTGLAFRAQQEQAKATIAAANTTPLADNAGVAAEAVADAATTKADEIKGDAPAGGLGNVPDP